MQLVPEACQKQKNKGRYLTDTKQRETRTVQENSCPSSSSTTEGSSCLHPLVFFQIRTTSGGRKIGLSFLYVRLYGTLVVCVRARNVPANEHSRVRVCSQPGSLVSSRHSRYVRVQGCPLQGTGSRPVRKLPSSEFIHD